ncbi:hypothetical protein C1645_840449 [Glomus cerebriforme]|uniref:Uncharacterized protein n=1 Tax=Glomus cerebriforme TaxID=658196 RepID=A0A397SB42_9GLOM|nr:hypothetical protein C1645_840449 [Glomus cerebriforme]
MSSDHRTVDNAFSLVELLKNGVHRADNFAGKGRLSQLWWAPACPPYGLIARCEKGKPTQLQDTLVTLTSFDWREIELHEELHDIEKEASSSIMHDTGKVVNTAIRNVRSTIRNINDRRKACKDQSGSEGIKRVKSICVCFLDNELQDSIYDIKDAIIDDEQTVNEFEEVNTKKVGKVNSSNYSEKWEVSNINITDRFQEYQKDVFRKSKMRRAYTTETFMKRAEIIKTNPYTIENPSLLQEISVSLHEASCENFIGEEVFMNGENNIKFSGLSTTSERQ